jgi:phospholipase C
MRQPRFALALALALVGCVAKPRTQSGTHVRGGDMAMGIGGGGVGDPPDLGAAPTGGDGDMDPSAPSCPSPVPADPLADARQECQFKSGAMPADTVGLDDAARAQLPIKHIVVMMKENRSFDHLFGALGKRQPDAETFPSSYSNFDNNNAKVTPFHLATTCVGLDPDHQWKAMHDQVNGGAMDGFVTSAANTTGSDGHFALGYYDDNDLPFYYFLADTFAIADHYFPSVRSGTFPNRDYLLIGTSDNVRETQYAIWPDPSLPTLFNRLSDAHVTWGVYGDDHALEECLNNRGNASANWEHNNPWNHVQSLLDGFASGDVPNVVFVDGTENHDDEHPTADVQVGEAWTRAIYEAAVRSPVWPSTVLLLTYDEAGGFFDHLPPPNDTCLARPQDSDFHELGVRVPLIAISRWARRHYVSKVTRQHTSITRFIEAVFGLPALTARDANSDALLDMFDFTCPPAPIAPPPPAGVDGCADTARIQIDKTSYTQQDVIQVTFSNMPGNQLDWVAVYPRNVVPARSVGGSQIWAYLGSSANPYTPHTGGARVKNGTVVLKDGSGQKSKWPLAPGSYTAYLLVDDGYTVKASVQFDVVP